MQAPINIEDIPGYREALEREYKIRAAAFDDDLPEFVEGIAVQPLNLLHVRRLEDWPSPFVCGGRYPMRDDAAVFLWCVSEEYEAAMRFRHSFEHYVPALAGWMFNGIRKRFYRQLKGKGTIELITAIKSYIAEAFQDSAGGSESKDFKVPHYSCFASIIANMSAHFHWPESTFLRMPLKRLFQYQRWLELRNNPKATMFNPSDKARREGLEKMIAESRPN